MSRGPAEPRATGRDPLAHRCGRLGRPGGQLLGARPWHRDDEVEPVEEGTRELVPERCKPLRRAGALGRRVSPAGTGTEVHRRHELESSREERLALHPCDGDDTVLERLSKCLERRPLELGQLVEKQDSMMGKARLARTRPGAAADDRRGGGAVMRRAERAVCDQGPLGRKDAGNRMDAHHLECFARLERRQDRRQAPAEHRLPGSGWSRKKQVVAARGRELERTSRALLAAYVREIGLIGLRLLVRRVGRWRPQLATEVGDRLREVAHRHCLDSAQLRLARRLGSAQNPLEPRAPRPFRDGERTAHGPDASVEGQLAHCRMLREPLDRKLPRRRQHRQCDREVEAGSFLPQTRGSEVDGDPFQRPLQLRGADAAADAVLGLGAGPIGQPDDGEPRKAAVDVRLHLDAPRLDADEGVGDGAREHSGEATPASASEAHNSATDQYRFVVLAGAPPRAAVDVPLESFIEAETGTLEDLRVERRDGR